jgi:hypothetical protein
MMRKLNLVYDDWIEGDYKPRPNGNKIYGDVFWDGQNLITNYTNRGLSFGFYENQFPKQSDRFEVKVCRIEDVKNNPEEKYYYVLDYYQFDLCKTLSCGSIDHQEKIEAVLKGNPSISENVFEFLRKFDNFFLMLLTAHEPEGVKAFKCLEKFIEKHRVRPKKIFVVNNNSKLNELKHTFIPEINAHSIKFIPNTSNLTLINLNSKFNSNKTGKFFLCHNRSPKSHRYSILTLLKNKNILDDVNWSLVPGHKGFGKHNFKELLNEEDVKKYEEEIKYFISFDIKKSDYELEEIWFKSGNHEINVEGLPIWMRVPEKEITFENSYVNIVTESYYISTDSIVHITEKSFRPFYYYQLPIFVATHHHIKHLKEIYGFDMFDDIIDHSYDEVLNDRDRLFKIAEEIKRLNNNKELVKEFYRNNYDRFEKNKNIIYNILKNTDDYLFFRSLV